MQEVRIVLAGGAPLLQAGIVAAVAGDVRLKLIAQTLDVQGADEFLRGHRCDVIVLNTEAPYAEAARLVVRRQQGDDGAQVKLVVLTDEDSAEELLITLRLGVEGYGIRRSLWPEDIRSAILIVGRGFPWLCPLSTGQLVSTVIALASEGATKGSPTGLLSAREVEVLGLAAEGAGEEEIAHTLYLSRSTVKTYLRRIREKLQATSRGEAVRLGYQRGLIPTRLPTGAA